MKRGDRVQVVCGEVRTVEDDQDQRPIRIGPEAGRIDDPAGGVPSASCRQSRALRHSADAKPCGVRESGQGRARRCRAALVTQLAKLGQRGGRKRGDTVEVPIRPTIGRQDSKRNPARSGEGLDLLKAVAPIGRAADQPDQHGLCPGQCLFDIGVDRQRVDQRGKIGEPQRRKCRIRRLRLAPAFRERTKIAVREGQDDKIRRLLPQILWDGRFLHPMRFAKDDVHGLA